MFLKIISLGFLLYILYRFVFGFLVPVFKATQKIRRGFRDVQQQANDNLNRQQASTMNANTSTGNEKKNEPVGDYIDFEEIKVKR
ncbi:MAG: hypothetical protein JWM28_2536 [Chitinophagaceae bacterium]|nr:hypothetical protein [Chitinophagaceae bacterium]